MARWGVRWFDNIPNSQFPIPCYLLPIACYLLPVAPTTPTLPTLPPLPKLLPLFLVSHAKREWGRPRQRGHGGNPRVKALPPQDRANHASYFRV